MRTAGYNSPHTMSIGKRLIGLVLVLSAAAHATTSWDSQTARFSKEIAAVSGTVAASLSIRNLSSLPNDEVSTIQKMLEAQLRDAGVQLRGPGNATAIRVTLSENARGHLWVAEVQQGTQVRVAMLEVERAVPATQPPLQSVTLRKTLLWSQPELMLDAALVKIGMQTYMAVLEPTQVRIYRMNTSKPELEQSLPIQGAKVGRDPRGRLVPATGYPFDIFVPGVTCTTNASLPLYLSCNQSDDPWPLGSQKAFFNSSRNYFTGALAPGVGKQVAPFYSAAELARPNGNLWIFAGVDGVVRATDPAGDTALPSSATRQWGSDIAGMRGCGNASYVVAATAGTGAGDSIRAYEIAGGDVAPISMPLEMSGPVLALWRDVDSVTAVVRNDRTNSYEAYSVSVACSH